MSYLHPRKVFATSCERTVLNNLQKHDSDTTIRSVQSWLKGKFHERLVRILLHAKHTGGVSSGRTLFSMSLKSSDNGKEMFFKPANDANVKENAARQMTGPELKNILISCSTLILFELRLNRA